ncbi:MAG: DUF6950 family protein [Tabrizicola sp.]
MKVHPRLPDWRSRLNDYLGEVAPADFRYGSNDCALFAAGAVRAMTGHDPAAAFRGVYSTLEGGLKRVRKAGFADHVAVVRTLFAEVPAAFAQVGDIAVLDSKGEPVLGVVVGEVVACLSPRGLGHVHRKHVTTAWRVP